MFLLLLRCTQPFVRPRRTGLQPISNCNASIYKRTRLYDTNCFTVRPALQFTVRPALQYNSKVASAGANSTAHCSGRPLRHWKAVDGAASLLTMLGCTWPPMRAVPSRMCAQPAHAPLTSPHSMVCPWPWQQHRAHSLPTQRLLLDKTYYIVFSPSLHTGRSTSACIIRQLIIDARGSEGYIMFCEATPARRTSHKLPSMSTFRRIRF